MTYTFKLSPTFYDDTRHSYCFDDSPVELKRTKREVIVTLSEADAFELHSRADHYAGEMAGEFIANGCGGLVSSARATLKRMAAQGYSWQQASDYRAKMREAA
jgi:hypothetical protein